MAPARLATEPRLQPRAVKGYRYHLLPYVWYTRYTKADGRAAAAAANNDHNNLTFKSVQVHDNTRTHGKNGRRLRRSLFIPVTRSRRRRYIMTSRKARDLTSPSPDPSSHVLIPPSSPPFHARWKPRKSLRTLSRRAATRPPRSVF